MPTAVSCGGQAVPAVAAPVAAPEAYNTTGWWQVPQDLAQPWLAGGALVVVPEETIAGAQLTCNVSW